MTIKFPTILADPPWAFKVWSKKGEGRSAVKHYPVMSLERIKKIPIQKFSAEDCALFLWISSPMLKQGLLVMKSWQFTFKTVAFVWVKTNQSLGFFMGDGYWTRANAELCLLGTKGHPKGKNADVSQIIMSVRRKHSQKPDAIYPSIERLVSGPYLEMFARRKHKGWNVWGNEVKSDIEL